jgi:hypothetical protein
VVGEVLHHDAVLRLVRGEVRVGDHGQVGARGQLRPRAHDQPGRQSGRPLRPGAVGQQPLVVLVHVDDELAPAQRRDQAGDRDHVRVDRHHHLGLGPPRQYGGPGQPLHQIAARSGVHDRPGRPALGVTETPQLDTEVPLLQGRGDLVQTGVGHVMTGRDDPHVRRRTACSGIGHGSEVLE